MIKKGIIAVMMTALSTAFTAVVGFVGQVVTALVGESGTLTDLLPLFVIGIAISLVMVVVKIIRKVTWGA